MLYVLTKALLSGAIIAAASEVAKRSPALGAVILSLPLVSVIAFVWLWRDTGDKEAIASLSESTFWFVLPTLHVPGASGATAKRSFLLVCTRSLRRPNRGPLFLGRMALSKNGHCLLRSSDRVSPLFERNPTYAAPSRE
jgi:hypothetical protein